MVEAACELGRARALLEAGVTAGLLLVVVLVAPLGSPEFVYATGAGCFLVFAYVAYHVARHPTACRRWGLVPDDRDGWAGGCFFLGVLYLVSLLPIALVQLLVEVPRVGHPFAYLLWCAVQDFVFFVLILRNLEDLTHPALALATTALLFGLSHYPFHEFMFLTGLVAAVWGFLYLLWRALLLITACHWVMGMLVLA
jgi:hypothetical protein